MGYFQTTRKTKKLKLPSNPEFWVEIYTESKWGQTKHFLQVAESGKIDMVASSDEFLKNAIKDWNLTDEAGAVAPVTPEFIDLMDSQDVLFLVGEAGGSEATAEASKKN